MTKNPVQETALHESGHAVAAMQLSVRFEAVELRIETVDGFWKCGGRLRAAQLPEGADNPRLWVQLIVIMAGYAAQSLLAPSDGFSVAAFKYPDDRDHAAADELLDSMRPPVSGMRDREVAMERAWLEARRILIADWKRVTAIADELVSRCFSNGEPVLGDTVLTMQDLSRLLRTQG